VEFPNRTLGVDVDVVLSNRTVGVAVAVYVVVEASTDITEDETDAPRLNDCLNCSSRIVIIIVRVVIRIV
jgi:hypothetical protein